MNNNILNLDKRYHLVLERKHGDFMPIDISLLQNGVNCYNKMELIDKFTEQYEYDEIIKLITNANITTSNYLNGNLYVQDINSPKYKYPVILKNTIVNNEFKNLLIPFIYYNIDNKNKMNDLCQKYLSLTDNKENYDILRNFIENKDLKGVIFTINTMPYVKLRMLNFYIIEKLSGN